MSEVTAGSIPESKQVPVALLIFNRPDLTAGLVDRLRSVKPAHVLVVADGPRDRREGESELCQQARQVVEEGIDWPAKVEWNRAERNLGCRRRVATGLDWVFEKVDRAIILEDDMLPDPVFFPFCAELLTRYEDDPGIGVIAGCNYQPEDFSCPTSYYFSHYAHCWGWATWRRAWQCYEHEMENWSQWRDSPQGLRSSISHPGERRWWSDALDRVQSEELDTWCYVWQYSLMRRGMLNIVPAGNLVRNVGFDERATHTKNPNSPLARLPVRPIEFPMTHPKKGERHEAADDWSREFVFGIADDRDAEEERLRLRKSNKELERSLADQRKAVERWARVLKTGLEKIQGSSRWRVGGWLLHPFSRARRKRNGWLSRIADTAEEMEGVGADLEDRLARARGREETARKREDTGSDSLPAREIKEWLGLLEGNHEPEVSLVGAGRWKEALASLDRIKARTAGTPERDTDFLRALCFLETGRLSEALEAAKEELRWVPDHRGAREVRDRLLPRLFPPPTKGDAEFREIYAVVRPFTMLSEERLLSLYSLAKSVCLRDVPGDFVECGVAGGGASALLAAVIKRHSRRTRKLYACDTFSGMPEPTDRDSDGRQSAEDSGWGTGTCSAPVSSVMELAERLGVAELISPVEGLFAETLPGLRSEIDSIAFLHLDGDWYESTRDILRNLYDLVEPTTFLQVDDYGYWKGCREAIQEFEKERSIEFQVHRIDGTGVWFLKPDGASDLKVNLGCGGRWHPDWVNFDIAPSSEVVLEHEVGAKPLPLSDSSCAAVYASHMLEHLPKGHVPGFLEDCFRVLAPGGVLRLVVPDLETIARLYLENLARAAEGDSEAKRRHEWMTIELIDQLSRHRSGGEMLEYWKQDPMPAEAFVMERLGQEASDFIEGYRAQERPAENERGSSSTRPSPEAVGAFRMGGEAHLWMYDRVSLANLCAEAGFTDFSVCGAAESRIEGFPGCCLDTDEEGNIRKPDSLFVEAIKPLDSD